MSLQSPLSPVSNRSELSFDDMPRPQRPIERMSSFPSLSHSSTTATSDEIHDNHTAELMTPTDFGRLHHATDDQEVLSPVAERKGGFRGLTKSMQSLRGRAKADKERSRSTSRERPPMPVLEPSIKSPVARTTPPMAIPQSTSSKPVRPKPQRATSSFSSFIRKLTGGGNKTPKASPTSPAMKTQPVPAPAALRPSTAREPSRKPTLAINTTAQRPHVVRKTSLPVDMMTVPAEPVAAVEAGPFSAPAEAGPGAEAYASLMVDPCTIALPPSPLAPALDIRDELDAETHDFSLSPASYDKTIVAGPSGLNGSPGSQGGKQEGKLMVGVPMSPTHIVSPGREASGVIEEEEEDEEDEGDVIQPLRSVTSPSGCRVDSPMTASTDHDGEIQTPISPGYNGDIPYRQNSSSSGSSPPRDASHVRTSPNQRTNVLAQAPPVAGLGRKESKWRKSVMNLSDTLNGSSRRVSKAPPTSYDNYLAHQQKVSTHRRSCAPTFHSTASVSNEIRQIKDKEQQEVADTFFLS